MQEPRVNATVDDARARTEAILEKAARGPWADPGKVDRYVRRRVREWFADHFDGREMSEDRLAGLAGDITNHYWGRRDNAAEPFSRRWLDEDIVMELAQRFRSRFPFGFYETMVLGSEESREEMGRAQVRWEENREWETPGHHGRARTGSRAAASGE